MEFVAAPARLSTADASFEHDFAARLHWSADTDAAIEQRVADMHADLVLYVVDKRQSLHFEQVFRASRLTGIAPERVGLEHLAYGTMNGSDGRPFKTRAGGVMNSMRSRNPPVRW